MENKEINGSENKIHDGDPQIVIDRLCKKYAVSKEKLAHILGNSERVITEQLCKKYGVSEKEFDKIMGDYLAESEAYLDSDEGRKAMNEAEDKANERFEDSNEYEKHEE